jgi:hypothetical protein
MTCRDIAAWIIMLLIAIVPGTAQNALLVQLPGEFRSDQSGVCMGSPIIFAVALAFAGGNLVRAGKQRIHRILVSRRSTCDTRGPVVSGVNIPAEPPRAFDCQGRPGGLHSHLFSGGF